MAYSDRIIYESVLKFQGRSDVTVTEIAEHAQISLRTAQRALKRLEERGEVERAGTGRRWGASYRVKGEGS